MAEAPVSSGTTVVSVFGSRAIRRGRLLLFVFVMGGLLFGAARSLLPPPRALPFEPVRAAAGQIGRESREQQCFVCGQSRMVSYGRFAPKPVIHMRSRRSGKLTPSASPCSVRKDAR